MGEECLIDMIPSSLFYQCPWEWTFCEYWTHTDTKHIDTTDTITDVLSEA
jgi:hypothetical protein